MADLAPREFDIFFKPRFGLDILELRFSQVLKIFEIFDREARGLFVPVVFLSMESIAISLEKIGSQRGCFWFLRRRKERVKQGKGFLIEAGSIEGSYTFLTMQVP